MTMRRWKSLYTSLEIDIQQGMTALPKPTNSSLDLYEKTAKFKLPKSYRSFVKVFGAGELACDFKILAPGYPASTGYDLQKFNDDPRTRFSVNVPEFRDEQVPIDRLVYFAFTETGELFGWNPRDVPRPRTDEYGIYVVDFGPSLQFVANTFEDFVDQVCFSDVNLHPPNWDDELQGSRRRFQPAFDMSRFA